MGGFFGAAAHHDVVLDVFFGVDYHSHLGTKCAGMIFHDAEGRMLPTRDPLDREHAVPHALRRRPAGLPRLQRHRLISDTDPQPLLVRSHLGTFGITTVGSINNAEELVERNFASGGRQFMAMSSGKVNTTELVAALINQKDDFVSGIKARAGIHRRIAHAAHHHAGRPDHRRARARWAACRCFHRQKR